MSKKKHCPINYVLVDWLGPFEDVQFDLAPLEEVGGESSVIWGIPTRRRVSDSREQPIASGIQSG